ncbi:response regulator transcription factor [Marinilactibacillus piezotolerans]|uniref:response regulator transcription factor n=1 Tax=Marinilactibacillus piezotolerans TaxID=258723 RepID=UPI0009AFA5EB|nr:response regulator [Marinilactibacillus piezotolerans]
MYSVILVDDEPIVREGMEYIINWSEEGFEVIGSAENGLSGLKMIEEKNPDLVITDVKMPGLDGLKMIEKAKQLDNGAKYIVLSGYSDFKYAQNAVSLGTFHYLLKPIDENELLEVLDRVKKQIDRESKEKREQKTFQDYLTNQQIFSFIFHRNTSQTLAMLEDYKSFQLLEVKNENKQYTEQDCLLFQEQLDASKIFAYNYGESLFLLICDGSAQNNSALIRGEFIKRNLQAAVSSEIYQISELPVLYKEILQLNSRRYFYPDNWIITPDAIRTEESDLSDRNLLFHLKMAIKDNQKQAIEEVIDQFVQYFRSAHQEADRVKREWSVLFLDCVAFLEESMNKPVKEIEKDKILSIIWKEKSILQTAKFLKYIFYDFGRFFYETNEKQDIVEEIKRYTAKNYHLNLSLKELAQQFNYSQSYLGKKFKAETSLSYHTYLDNKRLEKAKKLLQDETMYVYEIAKLVGYSNYDYFHKKFKKTFRMSPKEYQKNWKSEEME